MSHFDSIEIDINPCDDDDIDEQIQIYVYNTLVNEFPDDKMNLVLNEKEMRHYQDYGQGFKKCCNNSYSTVAFCMLEMNINDADCMDDNFNHETSIDGLRKLCCISKTMNSLLEIQLLTRISLTKCMKEYNKEFIFEL